MDLKHIIPQQRRRVYGPSLDIQYSVDRTNVPRVGPTPTFTRASSGTFVNENGLIVGKTTSTTSLNPARVAVGGVAIFEVPSGSVVGWLNNSTVVAMVDSDGNDQIGSEAHITGTLIHKTDTTIALLVTSKVGTVIISSWNVSYRGPRINFDPITGFCKGLLNEDTRTNLILRSTQFNESTYWSPIRLVSQPIANTHIAPDNTLSAEKLIPSVTLDDHRVDRPTVTVTSGQIYTCSVFVKADGYSGFGINLGSAPSPIGATFSLSGDGSVVSTLTGWTATIQKFPNGWFRCSATFTAASTAVRVYYIVGANETTFNYAGDETSGILIWGAQLELGRTVSSFIPTTVASAARSQDLNSITGSDFNRFYNQSEGTLDVKSQTEWIGGLTGIVSILAADRTICAVNVARGVEWRIDQEVIQGPSFAQAANFRFTLSLSKPYNSPHKSSIAFKENDFAGAVNGSTVQTDTSGIFPSSPMTRMTIGTNTGQVMYGHIEGLKYYQRRRLDTEIQTATQTISETIVYNGIPILYNGEGLIETT